LLQPALDIDDLNVGVGSQIDFIFASDEEGIREIRRNIRGENRGRIKIISKIELRQVMIYVSLALNLSIQR
jgi:pyruvate kinase